MTVVSACIVGALGRMGTAITHEASTAFREKMLIASAIETDANSSDGASLPLHPSVRLYSNRQLEDALKGVEVSIHFSHPDADAQLIPRIVEKGVNVVIGTTGFTKEQTHSITDAIATSKAAAVWATNFSPLVNVQFDLSKRAAALLAPLGYEFAVVEEHHSKKIDSPSGTAKTLLQSIAEGGGPSKVRFRGEESGIKSPDEIDCASIRIGGTVGDHEVRIAGLHGRLSIESLMYSRSDFANGALAAALWITQKNASGASAGRVYSMRDVLGL